VYDLVMAVAASDHDVQQIATRLHQLAERP
jgi:hypothetical protein